MLKILPKQPPEAPAQNEALSKLARFRTRLENCPDDKSGNWHEAATRAWADMLSIESMVSRLIDIRFNAPSQDASDAIEYAIDQIVEAASTLTAEAERRAEEDAPAYDPEEG